MSTDAICVILSSIGCVITIISAMWAISKHLLKDVNKEINMLKEDQRLFKEELSHVHNRLDGLYRVLLDRTYGTNIPDELK